MDRSKVKNGYRITVKAWDTKVTITKISTGEVVKSENFGNHIKAVLIFNQL